MKFRSARGQALVEMALILPVLVLIICAILDFGMYLYCKNQTEIASATGARMASLGSTDQAVETSLVSAYPNTNISITPAQDMRELGQVITVTVSQRYYFVTPVIAMLFGSSYVNVTSGTSMLVEVMPP